LVALGLAADPEAVDEPEPPPAPEAEPEAEGVEEAEELDEVVATAAALYVELPQTKVALHCCCAARSLAFVAMHSPLPALQRKNGMVPE